MEFAGIIANLAIGPMTPVGVRSWSSFRHVVALYSTSGGGKVVGSHLSCRRLQLGGQRPNQEGRGGVFFSTFSSKGQNVRIVRFSRI